jgi:phosphatidylserine decarboxylase
MATVWHGVVNPPRTTDIREWRYDDKPVDIARGKEMGRFLLGSTVVMLFPRNTVNFNPDWKPERLVQLCEAMGTRRTDA